MGLEDSLNKIEKNSVSAETPRVDISKNVKLYHGDSLTVKEDKKKENIYAKELVDQFKGGDEKAFDKIMALYKDKISEVVTPLLKNHEESEEIVQDVFIKAHRGLANFRGESSLITWLHTIAVNLARNRYWYWLRRKKDQHLSFDKKFSEDNDSILADIIPDDDMPSPRDQAENQELMERISVAMGKLTTKHREILVLRSIKHMSYEEIAATLTIDVGTVKSRIARARESLRALLPHDFPDVVSERVSSSDGKRKELKKNELQRQEELKAKLALKYLEVKKD